MTHGAPRGTALVTGTTSGLGAAFARELAARGHDLVLVARDEARLETGRVALEDRFGIQVEVLPADLTSDAGCAAVALRLGDAARPVEILVNNAGVGSSVPFGQPGPAALADAERQLDLNVRAVLRLCHAALTPMTARRRGLILNVSSTAGFVPRGGASTYAASKAWVTSFTESLALQAAPDGVRVCAVCPGFVRTEFHERAGIDVSRLPAWLWLDADAVARAGLDDALRGRIVSVPDVRYKALVAGALAVPRPALRRIMRQSGRIVGPR